MNDFVLTQRLIEEQERRFDLFNHIESNFLILLRELSEKVDAVIVRLKLFTEQCTKNKKYLIYGKAINDEYLHSKNEWNMYVRKIHNLLKKFANGNVILEDEARVLYLNLTL